MSFIYFAQNDSGHIKIGVTTDVARRLDAMQTATHERLTVIGVMEGDRVAERRLHAELRPSHIRGEWYQRSEQVEMALAACEKFDPAKHVRTLTKHERPYNDQASILIRRLVQPVRPGETVGQQVRRVQLLLPKWTASRVRDIWYNEPRAHVTRDDIEYLEAALGKQQTQSELDLASRVCDLERMVAVLAEKLAHVDLTRSPARTDAGPLT